MFIYEYTCCTCLEYDDIDVSCYNLLMIHAINDVIWWFMPRIDDFNL